MIFLPIPMICHVQLEHILHIPGLLNPIHGVTLTRMAYLILPEVRADSNDIKAPQ